MYMSGIMRTTIITCTVILILTAGLCAMASKPAYTGMKMPPALDGKTGAVTGRVTASTNTTGLASAYIAVVNASNASEEYFNTTSGADGYYQILGVNASYNATNASDVGPNGPTPYRIYAYDPILGEGYSSAFGIDSSSPGTGGGGIPPVAVSAPTAVPTITPTSAPTATPTAAPATATPVVTATVPASTATPQPTPYLIPPVLSLLIAGCLATLIVLKCRKN